jgi:hypothetical protein
MEETGDYCPLAFTLLHLKKISIPRKSRYLNKLTVNYGAFISLTFGNVSVYPPQLCNRRRRLK